MKVVEKIIFYGSIKNTSPLVIGKGKGGDVDIEIMKIINNETPYIPASSFVGALRHHFDEYFDVETLKEFDFFFGGKEYLFSWNDVPGTDSGRLLKFLRNNLKINWAKNAEIKKSDNCETITVINGGNSITLKLNKGENKVTLKIAGSNTHKYISKEEGDKINIYGKDKDGVQSHLVIEDLKPKTDTKISIRDGIKIDNKKGITIDKHKFEYEILEPGAEFILFGEITIREGKEEKDILPLLSGLKKLLDDEKIYLGAFTTKGFGRIELSDFKSYIFKFPDDGADWLKFQENRIKFQKDMDFSRFDDLLNEKAPTFKPQNEFIIDADFVIKSSLIVGSYTTEKPDKSNIKSGDNYVLPGTSIKGALRDRAVRIINTLDGDGEEMVKSVFGWADEYNKEEEKIKSRVIFEEIVLNEVVPKKQTRIKIDRFTGGTMDGALFESEPVWRKKNNEKNLNIKIRIKDYKNWEAGLLLLVLKDLWNADMPIGGEKNIGRGVLEGMEIRIKSDEGEFTISKDNDKLIIIGDKEKLEKYVKDFKEYINAFNKEVVPK